MKLTSEVKCSFYLKIYSNNLQDFFLCTHSSGHKEDTQQLFQNREFEYIEG